MLGFKLINVSKRGHWQELINIDFFVNSNDASNAVADKNVIIYTLFYK